MSAPSEPTIQVIAAHTLQNGELALTMTLTIAGVTMQRRIRFASVDAVQPWLALLAEELASPAPAATLATLQPLMAKPVAVRLAASALPAPANPVAPAKNSS